MRNLKRVLSLVMMIALLAGLMIVGASAAYQDFTDKDKIENKVAVETLVELNVIAGKEDGSFYDPEGLLTRAEAAKLVCVVLNGGKEPVLGNPDYVSYKDTKGTWGAAYIEYVTSLKIVAGDGQGYFKPDETVTGTQLAKMLLVALNYDANFENLVGNQWDSKTDALANQTELYEGLASGFVTSDPLNRDDAAQIIYNALTAHLVEYTSAGTDGSVGTHAVETNATVLSKYFNTDAIVGIVLANNVFAIDGGAETADGKIRVWVDNVNDIDYGDIETLPADVDNDMVGQEVTVYVKNFGKTTQSVLGSVIATENNKIVTTTAALEDDDDVDDFLKDNDLTVDANSGVVINGVFSDAGADNVKGDTCLQMAKAGSERRLIDNDNDGTVDVAFVTNKTLSKVTIYNTKESEITLAGANKMSFDDIVAYDGIAKGDYVLYVTYGSVTYIEKAQTVTGKVASFNKANNKATIDGTAYAESIVATATGIGLTNYLGEGTEAADGVDMIGETYVFYLDNSGNIIAKGPVVEGAKQYGLVIASNADVNSLGEPTGVIKLVLADGNEVAYNVDLAASADEYLKSELATVVGSTVKLVKADGKETALTTGDSKTDKERAMAVRLAKKDGAYATYDWADGALSEVAADGMVNHIVSYVVNDDGTVTIAPTQANKNNYNMQSATEDAIRTNSAYVQDSNTILADNSTIYFFVNDANGKVTVVTGINSLPTTDAGAAQVSSVAYTEQDGKYTAKAVVVAGAVKEEGTYVYILDEAEALGSNEYKYPVVSAADAGTITYLDSKVADQAAGLYKVTMEDGFAKFDQTNVVADAEVDQISADGSTLKTTTAQYTVLSTVKVVNVVDTDAPFAAELADLQDGQTISIVTDSDGYVAEIFITADAQQ